jgi:hypothetical protein
MRLSQLFIISETGSAFFWHGKTVKNYNFVSLSRFFLVPNYFPQSHRTELEQFKELLYKYCEC